MLAPGDVAAAALGLYVLFGAGSWGYIMLRSGWPSVRGIDTDYRAGWGTVIGALLSVLALGSAAAAYYAKIVPMPLPETILSTTSATLVLGAVAFTIKRKISRNRKVKVSVPKRIVSASVIAKKVVEKFPESSYVAAAPGSAAEPGAREHAIDVETYEKVKAREQQAQEPLAAVRSESASQKPGQQATAQQKPREEKTPSKSMFALESKVVAASKPKEETGSKWAEPPRQATGLRKEQPKKAAAQPERQKTGQETQRPGILRQISTILAGKAQARTTGPAAPTPKNETGAKPTVKAVATAPQARPAAQPPQAAQPAQKPSTQAPQKTGGQPKAPTGKAIAPQPTPLPPQASEKPTGTGMLNSLAKIFQKGKPAHGKEGQTVGEALATARKGTEAKTEPPPKDAKAAQRPPQGEQASGKRIELLKEKLAGKAATAEQHQGKAAAEAKAPATTPAQQVKAQAGRKKGLFESLGATVNALRKPAAQPKAGAPQRPTTQLTTAERQAMMTRLEARRATEFGGRMEENKVVALKRKLGELEAGAGQEGRQEGKQAPESGMRTLRQKLSIDQFREERLAAREKAETAEQILGTLEKKRKEKSGLVMSSQQLAEEAEKSKEFIRESLKEKIAPEAGQETGKATEQALPKSARLLKQLLSEENGQG